VRIRGTPFVTAVVMSAAAMFLIPEAVHHTDARNASTTDGSALPAAPTAEEPGTTPPPSAAAPGAVTPGPTAPIQARALPGTARTLRTAPVTLPVNGFWSWALLDRRTGALDGSANQASRSDTASMIKVWIAADYLRRAAERGQQPPAANLRELSTMIRDSNNEMADKYHRANGGSASITRMIKQCGLTDSRPVAAGSWSTTEVSARDGARLAVCLADGRGAGNWTNWLLSEMRQVRGAGRFGIVTAFAPDVAAQVAIKNGWINRRDGKWHIACLAVTGEWALTVLTQYPVSLGFSYGTNICKQVAVQLGASA
jgi:hypothetical protein